jgi:hypothetical protein
MKKEFEVEVSYVFKGKFFIKAESQEEANENAEKHCGLVLGRDIHSTLNEDVNWDFPVHPEKIIHTVNKDIEEKLDFETIEILQHEIAYTYRDWDGRPNEVDIEHLESMITQGYNQGELHTLDGETEHSGWWRIK